MKSFFSRLHDSTHTGHSKPASKESYKFWTPSVDPEREYAQPSNSHGEVAATYPTTRHGGEKRSSSRAPKPTQTAPIPFYEQNTTTNATAGPSSEKVPNLGSKPNPSAPTPQYSQIPLQVTSKATSTRYRDYNDSKPHPPPPSATRPSYSTRTYAAQENAAKMSRHANSRSESTPAVAAHEIRIPPSIAPAPRQTEERAKEPVRQETIETLHRYHSRNEVKDAPINDTRRERDRDRPRDRDRDRERTRDREGVRDAGREGGREREVPRDRYRHQGRDREVDPDRDREKYRERDREQEREKEKEKELARQRGRDRDREGMRERERGKEEVEKGRRERERVREQQREREPAERERERRDRDREVQRQAELAKDAEREKRESEGELQRQAERERERERRDRDRELRRQMEVARENDRLKQERDRDVQRQAELAREAEREKRDRERALQRQMEYAKEVERLKEVHDREVQQQLELAREAEREKRDRERAIQRQMEFARETERVKEREAQRQVELAREAERERVIQRQMEYAKEAELIREREREVERQAELAKEVERLKEEREREAQRQSDLAHEAERVREREAQRQAELAKEAERARDWERRDRERAFQRQMELAKEAVRQKQERDQQAEPAKEAERQKQERDREAYRQAELAKEAERERERQEQEKVLQRQAELVKETERERERREHERDLRRQAELAKLAERQKQERERELQRQAEREKEAERERDRQEREKEAQQLAELAKEAERERERRDRERALQRQVELAKEVERLKEAREREVQRQADLAKEAERIREREAEREREKQELQRQVELAKEVDRERERRDRERAHHQQMELAREAARMKEERELELQRQTDLERQRERDAELQRHMELAKEAERERLERERIAQRQMDHAKQAERLREEQEREVQRQAEFTKEAERLRERERERKEVEREREREQRRERKHAEEVEREKDRERVRGAELQREKESEKQKQATRDKDREHDREQAIGDERDKDRGRERTVNAEKEPEREQERYRQWGRRERERERQHPRGHEHDRNRERGKDKEPDLNKGSPNARARGTKDIVKGLEQQQSDRLVTESPKNNVTTQDHEMRGTREVRPIRETPRPRDRQRDQVRYRAEVTDGEQDLKRPRPVISTDRDRRKGTGSGWASDNYTSQARKSSRPLASGAKVQADEAEASDGSINKKHVSRKPQKRSVEEGSPNKAVRSRNDKYMEGLNATVSSPAPANLLHLKTLPSISERRPPMTSTPQNIPMYLPPRDMPNDLEVSPALDPVVAKDNNDVPTRREINRLKLHTRTDELSHSASTSQPVAQLSHSKASFELDLQHPKTNDPISFAPQYPPRVMATTQHQGPALIAPRVDNWTVGTHPSGYMQANTPVAQFSGPADEIAVNPRVAQVRKEHSGNPYAQSEGARELPNEAVLSPTAVIVNVDDTAHHGMQLVGRETSNSNMFNKLSTSHTPTNSNLQKQQAQLPDLHPSIAVHTTKVEGHTTQSMPQFLPSGPAPTDVKQVTSNNAQALPQNLRVSNAPLQPLSSETNPVLDIRMRSAKKRESPGTMALPLNEDAVDLNFSREEASRHDSSEQLPEQRGKALQAVNAWQYDATVEKPPTPMGHKDLSRHRVLGSVHMDSLQPSLDPSDMQRRQNSSTFKEIVSPHLIATPENFNNVLATSDRHGAVVPNHSNGHRPEGVLESVDPVMLHKGINMGHPSLTGMSRPPTSLAIKTDAATIDRHIEESANNTLHPLGNAFAKIHQESPDSKEQNIEAHARLTSETTAYWQSKQNSPKGVQWSSATPVDSRPALPVADEHSRYLQGIKQESPRRDTNNSHLTSPLLQTTRSASKQGSPLQSGPRHGHTNPQIPDNPSAPEQMGKSASNFPVVIDTSTRAADTPVAAVATPKQDAGHILSLSYSGQYSRAPFTGAVDSHRNVISGHVENMRIQLSQSGSRGHVGRQISVAQTEDLLPKGKSDHPSLSVPTPNILASEHDRENVIETHVGVEAPSLGFFTNSFSKALTKATDEKPLGTPPIESMPSIEKELATSVPWHVSSVDESARNLASKASETHRTALQNHTESSVRAHSRFPSMEHPTSRKEAKEQADSARSFKPPTPKPVDVNKDTEPSTESWQLPRLQPSKIQHPVLADLLSSPLAPKAPVISRNEVLPSIKSQETRQRTYSSSTINPTQSELPKSGESPLERPQNDIGQHVPLQRYPSELPKQSSVDHTHGAVTDREARAYSTRPPSAQPGSQSDILRQTSSQRYHTEPLQRPSTGGQSREILPAQETRSTSTRPSTAQPAPPPPQEKETVHQAAPFRQIFAQRVISEQPQKVELDGVREGQAQNTNSQMVGSTVQSSIPPPQAQWQDVSSPFQAESVRQTSSQRYLLDSSQRPVTEQSHELPSAHEVRTHSMKASSIQPTSSVTQGLPAHPASVMHDPPLSSGRTLPSLVHSSFAPQDVIPAEQITTSRHGVSRSGVVDPLPSQDRRTSGMHSNTVHQGQSSSSTRPATSDNHYRVHPQTSADSRFPNISQTSASQVAAAMQQNSSRHRYSTSLPTFLPPSTTKLALKEEVPRSSTPAHTQYKPNSSQPVAGATLVQLTTSIPKAPSEETVLLTPSSLAHSLALKPTSSRQSVTPSVTSQASRKGVGFFNMFRKTSTPAPGPAQQYQIWHPNAPAKTPDSSPKSVPTPPEPPISQPPTTIKRAPPPSLSVTVPVPIHDNRNTSSHVFTPFRYLTTRRNRAVSVASLEAHDGTATNTVIGSPTASMHSTAPPMLPPPLRDPYLATEEWRDKEEARAHARAKIKRRRQRPGVVFDVDEEDPNVVKQRPRRVKTKGRSSSKQPESSQP